MDSVIQLKLSQLQPSPLNHGDRVLFWSPGLNFISVLHITGPHDVGWALASINHPATIHLFFCYPSHPTYPSIIIHLSILSTRPIPSTYPPVHLFIHSIPSIYPQPPIICPSIHLSIIIHTSIPSILPINYKPSIPIQPSLWSIGIWFPPCSCLYVALSLYIFTVLRSMYLEIAFCLPRL